MNTPRMLAYLARLYWLRLTDRVRLSGSIAAGAITVLVGGMALAYGYGTAESIRGAAHVAFGYLGLVSHGTVAYMMGRAAVQVRLGPSRSQARLALKEAELDTEIKTLDSVERAEPAEAMTSTRMARLVALATKSA